MELKTSEAQLQAAIIRFAKLKGWQVAHFDRAQVRPGIWVTPVTADGKGWPDLILVRNERLIAAELKAKSGRIRPEQAVWLALLRNVPGIEVYVWLPEDWPDNVQKILS
jgi:hypothetical protein